MKSINAKRILTTVLTMVFISSGWSVLSQELLDVGINDLSVLSSDHLILSDSSVISFDSKPLFSFVLNGQLYNSLETEVNREDDHYSQIFEDNIKVTLNGSLSFTPGWKGEIIIENDGMDTVSISNVVPFGEDINSVYITGRGPWDLARAWLFRPGFKPVRIILPDNAWEMGYSSFETGKGYSVCAIARRGKTEGGEKQRYTTVLPPYSSVVYTLYADIFTGEWQNGLRLMFRDRYLYDLKSFDNALYEREDLSWIKRSYLIILQMAWDREFYDRFQGKYTFPDIIRKGLDLFGNIDVLGIWPTWPRLGLDKRNQWDMYSDLPGGTTQLRNFARMARMSGTKYFIAYNPWDNSTRKEEHLKGLTRLVGETEADGVVLDTRGSSSIELQAAADSAREGVVMYSEGMAIAAEMPGIISGRVHNAIYYSPELNMNKLIKPDFSIFRVCDVGEDIVHREIAIAFFNGYGTELNMYRPGGRDDNYDADLGFLARTTFILRQNNDAFLDHNWTPLIHTSLDDVYVNRWRSGGKSIYTVLNMRAEGINGELFSPDQCNGKHFVSLWHHENITPVTVNDGCYIKAKASGWDKSFSGTRREGSVDCIAEFPELIRYKLTGDSIKLNSTGSGNLVMWKGNPSYQTESSEFKNVSDTTICIRDIFGYFEGKIVIQLIENEVLKDEIIVTLRGGKPWLISKVNTTEKATNIAGDMVLVPGAVFSYEVTTRENFIPYPEVNNIPVRIDSFLIDKYPVTNAQYYEFLLSSGYWPKDTTRFLRHWESGMFKQGQENYPVVYVSYEDIEAYTQWAGKRLPTEAEWQLAAQGTDKRLWPWGDEFHGTFCNNSFDRPTPVDAFPKGQSPYGVFDMVGNIWQVTNDMYFNGTNYLSVIRGGSYYDPESSWWYIEGGPQPLDKTQILLMVSPGFDRSETVGFRCVKDIDASRFKAVGGRQ